MQVFAPNDFQNTAAVAQTLNEAEHHYNQIAKPFERNFTRETLVELLDGVGPKTADHPSAAIAA